MGNNWFLLQLFTNKNKILVIYKIEFIILTENSHCNCHHVLHFKWRFDQIALSHSNRHVIATKIRSHEGNFCKSLLVFSSCRGFKVIFRVQQAVKITFVRAPAVKCGSAIEQSDTSPLDIRFINDSTRLSHWTLENSSISQSCDTSIISKVSLIKRTVYSLRRSFPILNAAFINVSFIQQ